jgi:dimethylargininase
VRGCLHLKTGVTSPAEGLLLINPEWIDRSRLPPWKLLEVPEGEPWGANVLAINGTVLAADSAPRTADLLESGCGLHVRRLGISEFQKAEAGLTCLSVLFRGPGESVPNSK